MNQFRNEMEISVGAEKILLRPTFKNIAELETNLGSIAWLAWKFSRGVTQGSDGKVDANSFATSDFVKSQPSFTDIAQIIYYCQADTDPSDASKRKYSLEEIWGKVINSGAAKTLIIEITIFIGKMLAGANFDENKNASEKETQESEKKS